MAQAVDLKTTGLRVIASGVETSYALKAQHIIIDTLQNINVTQRLNAGNNGYIDLRAYRDGGQIHLNADLGVSAGDDWNGEGAGYIRLLASEIGRAHV